MVVLFLAALAASATLAHAHKPLIPCSVTLDGRVPFKASLTTFDTSTSPFNPDYTKGENLSWSEIIQFPATLASRFDTPILHKAIEVTIDDRSIFRPGADPQVGFRRAGLLLGNGSDETNVGVKTFHWSVKQPADKKRGMNLTHEYMNAWHEANDYASNQFSINAGVMLAQDNPKDGNGPDSTKLDRRLWKVLDRENKVIWTGSIKSGVWQNFAITMDIEKNTLRVYYSEGYEKLKAVTKPVKNDNSGGGQFQIGLLKKPTETKTVVFDGYQESGIHEGQVYGGIFIEDSKGGCISV